MSKKRYSELHVGERWYLIEGDIKASGIHMKINHIVCNQYGYGYVYLEGQSKGYIGALHPDTIVFSLDDMVSA